MYKEFPTLTFDLAQPEVLVDEDDSTPKPNFTDSPLTQIRGTRTSRAGPSAGPWAPSSCAAT